jgi:hypothetical protein
MAAEEAGMKSALRAMVIGLAAVSAGGAPCRAQQITPQGCFARYANLCDSLQRDPRVILSTTPTGAFLLNPSRSGREVLNYPPLRAEIARGLDQDRLERELRPMFERLVAIVRERVETLSPNDPVRGAMTKRLRGLTLEALDRDRCRAPNRPPFVAAYDNENGFAEVCPWMTHLAPESMLSTLAHEVGHFVDPCGWSMTADRPGPDLPSFPAGRAANCSGDDEAYADAVGALLTGEFLRREAAAPLLDFPSRPDERAAALTFYMLQPDCRIAGNPRLAPFFAHPQIQSFLGCSTP